MENYLFENVEKTIARIKSDYDTRYDDVITLTKCEKCNCYPTRMDLHNQVEHNNN